MAKMATMAVRIIMLPNLASSLFENIGYFELMWTAAVVLNSFTILPSGTTYFLSSMEELFAGRAF